MAVTLKVEPLAHKVPEVEANFGFCLRAVPTVGREHGFAWLPRALCPALRISFFRSVAGFRTFISCCVCAHMELTVDRASL